MKRREEVDPNDFCNLALHVREGLAFGPLPNGGVRVHVSQLDEPHKCFDLTESEWIGCLVHVSRVVSENKKEFSKRWIQMLEAHDPDVDLQLEIQKRRIAAKKPSSVIGYIYDLSVLCVKCDAKAREEVLQEFNLDPDIYVERPIPITRQVKDYGPLKCDECGVWLVEAHSDNE